MKSEWKTMYNPENKAHPYAVYRILNTKEPMHSGNIEYNEAEFTEKEEAERLAEELNEKEKRA